MQRFETINRQNTNSAKWDRALKKSTHPEDALVFSVADSDYETAPAIKKRLAKRVEHGAYGYTHLGDEYANIVKAWFLRRYDVTIQSHWVLSASKVLNAISSLIHIFTDVGDKVLIQPPVYHVFKPLIEKSQRIVYNNPLVKNDKGYTIDFDGLETAFKQGVKTMIFCNPHNPVGRVWTQDEILTLMRLTRQYDVLLISDDIHADLISAQHRFYSIAHHWMKDDKMVVVSAPSKTFNLAGLKSAHLIIRNHKLRQSFKAYHEGSFQSGLNLFALEAIKTAYTACDDWVDAQNIHVEANHKLAIDMLGECEGLKIIKPEGTYLLWVDVSDYNMSGETFTCQLFKQENMMVAPGEQFGPGGEGFVRLNLACSTAQTKAGMKRMIRFLKQYKGAPQDDLN